VVVEPVHRSQRTVARNDGNVMISPGRPVPGACDHGTPTQSPEQWKLRKRAIGIKSSQEFSKPKGKEHAHESGVVAWQWRRAGGFSIPQSCSQCPGSERPAQTSQRPEEYKAMCRCHARLAAFLFQMEGERRKALWWGLKLKPDNLGALEGSKNGLIAHQQGRRGLP